jgi:LysR family glycine cleavage system transcriptional activator
LTLHITKKQKLPKAISAQALSVFEVAARLGSFTAAARELEVTQSAISRMISRLEASINITLFERSQNSLKLTVEGEHLRKAVESGFNQIAIALSEIGRHRMNGNTVTLSVSTAFAMHWFMSRMEWFHQSCPDIDLEFHLSSREPEGIISDVDLAIRRQDKDSEGIVQWHLMNEEIVLVCSDSYLSQHGELALGEDISHHTLIHLSGVLRLPWQQVLIDLGLPSSEKCRGLTSSDYSLVIQAAIKGQGVALGWRHVVADELHSHLLVPAFNKTLITGDSYFLVASETRALRDNVKQVRDWLLAEIQTVHNVMLT